MKYFMRSASAILFLCLLARPSGLFAAGTQPSGKSTGPAPALADTVLTAAMDSGQPVPFREIWGYLMRGEEASLNPSWPISDIGYFGAGLNNYGKLSGVPDRARLAEYGGRVHLVVAEVSNQALTHFCLDPSLPMRDALVQSIVDAAISFDGVQIDFELVPAVDRDNFISFLTLVGKKIAPRTLSVALPARVRPVDDAYDYDAIGKIADRIIIMAYDEHWSGSAPGAVASLDWCAKVAAYAGTKISRSRLVMGLPFYGRAWGEINPSKAYRFSAISRLIDEKNVGSIERKEGIPTFEYEETIKVRVFFDDARSTLARARLYCDSSVRNISFWRLGQEDSAIWEYLSIGN
jgi:hypothetical protein